jgi:hypothetical protein
MNEPQVPAATKSDQKEPKCVTDTAWDKDERSEMENALARERFSPEDADG